MASCEKSTKLRGVGWGGTARGQAGRWLADGEQLCRAVLVL